MPQYRAEVVFNIPVDRSFTYASEEALLPGCRVIAPFRGRSLAGFVIETREAPEEENAKTLKQNYTIKNIKRVVDGEPLFDAEYLKLAQWVASMYFASLGETLAAMLPTGRRETESSSLAAGPEEITETAHTLSGEQNAAVETILKEPKGTHYLFGITGSGKTEVFLRAADRTLAEGRSVIYLVPEIALTGQVLEAIRSRFGAAAAVLHSRFTPSQRLREWRRILRGEVSLVVGARSAVFAPLKNLGLIVLDEEHEGSYKSSGGPRYHARQVAMRRASLSSARLVMGSATPSVEAYSLMQSGKISEIRLTQRLSGGSPPSIEVVNLAAEEVPFSRPLKEAVLATWKKGRQTILFLNRRGFSHFFHCNSCGYEMKCKNCSVGLTYHKAKNRMMCHYCGFTARPLETCPECGSLDVGFFGFGTEKIEEEAARVFPELTIARLDTDSVKSKGSLEKTLTEFREGRIDLLLGTQMVAKGLNFRGVSLVGIILADTGLNLPDFRSLERTFALIVQVSGRAGRFSPDGRVIVQTYMPGSWAIRCAAEGKLEDFYRSELEARKALAFPPFSRLFRLVFRGEDDEGPASSARDCARLLRQKTTPHAEILGPCECPLAVLAGKKRRQLLIKTTAFGRVHAALSAFLKTYRPPPRVSIEVDVDPVSLL
jgi:primosomal protein N' (replication factor Y)